MPEPGRPQPARLVLAASVSLLLAAPAAWSASQPDRVVPVAAVGDVVADEGDADAPRPEVIKPVRAIREVPTKTASVSGAAPKVVPQPTRLRIGRLVLDAPVTTVGVRSDNGEMEVPVDVDTVGLYDHGPVPGEARGSAVIAGHVDSRSQGPGAFYGLRTLEVGDVVEVDRADAPSVRYAVTSRRSYAKEVLATEELFARDGPARLVLVTCGGAFDRRERQYDENVVVVAEPV